MVGPLVRPVYDAHNYYRRDRDLNILGILAFRSINVVDDYIDAEVEKAYAGDSNLEMKVEPSVLSQ